MKQVDMTDLKSVGQQRSCGFDSRLSYKKGESKVTGYKLFATAR